MCKRENPKIKNRNVQHRSEVHQWKPRNKSIDLFNTKDPEFEDLASARESG
jgi:hypothetical protein